MKIEVTEGCICYACEIDGRDYNDLSEDELRTIAIRLLDKCQLDDIKRMIWDSVMSIGEWEDLGHCEQCGDYISRYTVEV